MSDDSFRSWLRNEIAAVLRRANDPPIVLWCDPERSWRDLLKAAEDATFELWADGEHQLILRDRVIKARPAPRVIWLPVAVDEITYLKVVELQSVVWTDSLVAALSRFGVEIDRDNLAELKSMLRTYAVEYIDRPRSAWRYLTPGGAKAALVDDDQILSVLARPNARIVDILGEDRLGIFTRRVTEDFGLPTPVPGRDEDWRVAATARLLVTEAAARVPAEPPNEADKTIPHGASRDRALKLLARWEKHVELMNEFEVLSRQADATTSLVHWARNLTRTVPSLASGAAEDALFQQEVASVARLEEFEPLARKLEEREPFYVDHAKGFWGCRADKKVAWASLVLLARASTLIRQQVSAESVWKTPNDAIVWFTTVGWDIDRHGEMLFRDDAEMPAALHGVRARLRKAYLRHLDRCNAAFSELLNHHGTGSLGLSFAGEVLAKARPPRDPMAVLVLDACRYDLGARIAEALDTGEPTRRSEILPVRAPLPSITAIGMPFALADSPEQLAVELSNEPPGRWRVIAEGSQDLTLADARRDWLRKRLKLKPAATTKVASVLEADPPSPKESGRLLFVFGDEFDAQGHEGELRLSGADEYIERYVRVIRRLRTAGYSTIAVVTDHGFIHWQPDSDEVEPPPNGAVMWRSRRAVVGRQLTHPTALALTVDRSDLECMVPRSVNAFKTYGGLGYFHGGATLQELVTPVIIFRWPKKAEKVAAVLTPITEITSLKPRVEVKPGVGQSTIFGADDKMTGRLIVARIVESKSGRVLFKSASHKLEPEGQPLTIGLERKPNETYARGGMLEVQVRDADNDELLDRCVAELKVDLEEWD